MATLKLAREGFRPASLLNRIIDGIRLGYPKNDVIDNEVSAMTNDEFLEWLDTPESVKWIRKACRGNIQRSMTGTDIVMEALVMCLESMLDEEVFHV